jgi:hypothetical protein
MAKLQEAPAASDPGVEEVGVTSGQAPDALLFSVKPVVILGSLPLAGIGNVSAALPTFSTVTVCGLSLLIAPAGVVAKLRLGAVARAISFTLPSTLP